MKYLICAREHQYGEDHYFDKTILSVLGPLEDLVIDVEPRYLGLAQAAAGRRGCCLLALPEFKTVFNIKQTILSEVEAEKEKFDKEEARRIEADKKAALKREATRKINAEKRAREALENKKKLLEKLKKELES